MTDRIAALRAPGAETVWGIDVGRYALKALQVGFDDADGCAVGLAFDVVEYAEALRLDAWRAQPIVASAVARFLERNEVDGCRIALAAAGRTGLIRCSRLPQVRGRRLRDLMAYEARFHIPVALNDVVWDYQALPAASDPAEGDFPMADIALFALTREASDQTLAPLVQHGIEPDLIQLEPAALANFAVFDQAIEDEHEVVALLDVGARGSDLVIQLGERLWRHVMPIGGNHFTQALVDALGIGFDNAEQVKCNFERSRDPQAALRAMAGGYEALIDQAERAVGHFRAQHPAVKIDRTLLLGSGSKVPGLASLLPRHFGKVERLSRFARLKGDEVLKAPKFQAHAGSFGVAYGLGLQALGLGRWQTNLLPAEQRPRRPWSFGALLGRFRGSRAGR